MMQEILAQAKNWLDSGDSVAIATIVRISGSSSQPLGARMIMTTGHRFAGAVSGGCVETDVYETGSRVLRTGQPVMLHYQHVDNPVIEIGLKCEGKIDVLVEPLTESLHTLLARDNAPRYVNVTVCSPGSPTAPDVSHARVLPGSSVQGEIPPAIVDEALAALHRDKATSVTYPDGRVALFEPILPPPTLLIFGAEQTAVPLVRLARILGFRAVVTDGRPAFATREKHPDADEVIAAWPQDVVSQVEVDERTFVVSLNHEPRFEDAMVRALAGKTPAYIGAVGKRIRAEERQERLQAAGFDLTQLPPIHTPIGLDIGGKSHEEMALSILAEIISVRNGRDGGKLFAENNHTPKDGT